MDEGIVSRKRRPILRGSELAVLLWPHKIRFSFSKKATCTEEHNIVSVTCSQLKGY